LPAVKRINDGHEGSVFELNLPVQALESIDQSKETVTGPSYAPLPTLKILVAEDNPTNQKVLTAQLAQLGQSAEITNNGAEAMEKLKNEDFDVVILDILMPVMDGEETIQTIRESKPEIAQHYCIALTASSFQDQRARLLKLGFDAFLSKPLTLDQLAGALSEVPHAPKVETGFGLDTKQSRKSINQEPGASFDFTFLKTQFGDAHKSIFKEIAPTFLSHAYAELEQLKAFKKAGSAERVKRASHSMKGAASSIGLSQLANVLMQIENQPDSPTVSLRIEEVEKIMYELKPLIQNELDAIA